MQGINFSNSGVGVRGVAVNAGGTAGVFDNIGGGNILVGQVNEVRKFRVDGSGNVYGTTYNTGGADFAESIAVVGEHREYEPADVLVIDSSGDRAVAKSSAPYSTLVAGIYSTKPESGKPVRH